MVSSVGCVVRSLFLALLAARVAMKNIQQDIIKRMLETLFGSCWLMACRTRWAEKRSTVVLLVVTLTEISSNKRNNSSKSNRTSDKSNKNTVGCHDE